MDNRTSSVNVTSGQPEVKQDSANSNESEKTVDEGQVSLPGEVAGSYLVCHSVEDKKDLVSQKYTTRLGCAVTNDDPKSVLAFENKSTDQSYSFVSKHFQFSTSAPDSFQKTMSGAKASVTRADKGSSIDFLIDVEASSLADLKSYLDKLNVNVVYKDDKVADNASDPRPAKAIPGIFTTVADTVGGTLTSLGFTNANNAFDIKQPKMTYDIPGRIGLDGNVRVVTTVAHSEAPSGVENNIYTVVSYQNEFWGFGEFLDTVEGQISGSSNSLFSVFGNMNIPTLGSIFGGKSDSAIYSSTIGPDGMVYGVGRLNVNGRDMVTEDKYNGYIVAFDNQKKMDFSAIVGQNFTNEVFYGLDFEENRYLVAVGHTERPGMLGPRGGYIAVADLENGTLPYHQWISTFGTQKFNSVSVRKDGTYLIAGQAKREGCDHFDGWIVILDRKQANPTNAIVNHKILGLGQNDVFNRVTSLDDGGIMLEGVMEVSAFTSPNEGLSTEGEQSVYVYLDKDMNLRTAVLADGTPINISDFTDNATCD